MTKFFVFVLIAAGLVYVGIILLGMRRVPQTGQVRVPTAITNPAGIEELTRDLNYTVDSVLEGLRKISDPVNAQNALATIEDATSTVISLKLDRLPDSHKSTLMIVVKPMVDRIVKVLKGLYKLPGVQAIIEPAISPMLSRLQAFANVSAD